MWAAVLLMLRTTGLAYLTFDYARSYKFHHLGRELDGFASHLDEADVVVLVEDFVALMKDELLHFVISLFITWIKGENIMN